MCLSALLPCSPSSIGHSLECYVAPTTPHHLHTTSIEPATQILALTNVEQIKVPAAFHHGFDASSGDANAPTHGEVAQFEEMQGDAAERSV